jgi:hypothetical protein
MKSKLLYLFLLLGTICLSQDIDSSWYVKYYIDGFISDTGKTLPQVELFNENGAKVKLSDYSGTILYIGTWASSCGGSIANFPHQEQLLKRLKLIHLDTSIQIINIHVEDSKKSWVRALKKYKPIGINLFCSDTSILAKWSITSPPTYILLDYTGKVIGKEVPQPDSGGSIDYILYSLIKKINIIDALWIKYEQEQLMAEHKTADALNNEFYRDWFNLTIKSFIEYQNWRAEHSKKNSR